MVVKEGRRQRQNKKRSRVAIYVACVDEGIADEVLGGIRNLDGFQPTMLISSPAKGSWFIDKKAVTLNEFCISDPRAFPFRTLQNGKKAKPEFSRAGQE